MTPLEIDILLHYYTRGTDYRDGDLSAPILPSTFEWFEGEWLLKKGGPNDKTRYVITDRGRAFCEVLQAVPLPKQAWVMEWPK